MLLQILISSSDTSNYYNTNVPNGIRRAKLTKVDYLQSDSTQRLIRVVSPQIRLMYGNKQYLHFASISDGHFENALFTIDFSSPLQITIDNGAGSAPTSFSYCILTFDVEETEEKHN